MAARLQAQIPEAKVGFGHGKMPEESFRGLAQGHGAEINVLVCTTIIETEWMFPTNTIIIETRITWAFPSFTQIRGRWPGDRRGLRLSDLYRNKSFPRSAKAACRYPEVYRIWLRV